MTCYRKEIIMSVTSIEISITLGGLIISDNTFGNKLLQYLNMYFSFLEVSILSAADLTYTTCFPMWEP